MESITPAAPTFQAGGTLGLTFDVINQGIVATSTPHWTDNVFLSLDNKLSGDDILLTSVGNQSALQPGESYESTVSSIPIPKAESGEYYLIVETNANDAVDEYPNGNNNTLAVPITINPFLPSDLVVSNVIVPTQAIAGSQVQVTWTVTNLGLGRPTSRHGPTASGWPPTRRNTPMSRHPPLDRVHTGVSSNDPHDPDLPQSYTETATVPSPSTTTASITSCRRPISTSNWTPPRWPPTSTPTTRMIFAATTSRPRDHHPGPAPSRPGGHFNRSAGYCRSRHAIHTELDGRQPRRRCDGGFPMVR